MAKYYQAKPDYAVLPGETIQEMIENMAITKKEFALRLGITEQSLNRILKGKQAISQETALGLERITGLSNNFWMNLETDYQRQLRYLKQIKEVERYHAFLKRIPYKELIKRGFIEKKDDVIEQLNELLGFFKVASVEAYNNLLQNNLMAARSSEVYKTEIDYAFTYQNMGAKEAGKIDLQDFSDKKLSGAIENLRELSRENPEIFVRRAQEILADAGIALVYIQGFPKMHLNALCKWNNPLNAMIVMNDKGKAEDIFWFSLFHELGHLKLHSKKMTFLNYGDTANVHEKEADDFAAETLISSKYNDEIAEAVSDADIKTVATEVGVSVGIVAGRYRYLTGNHGRFRHLIRKVEIHFA